MTDTNMKPIGMRWPGAAVLIDASLLGQPGQAQIAPPPVPQSAAPAEGAVNLGTVPVTAPAMIWNLGAVTDAAYYMPRAYWGALHDHRRAENQVAFAVERTPVGLRIKHDLDTWRESLARPIRAC